MLNLGNFRSLPSRKIPIALQSRIKHELDDLCERSIISPINEPTKWVSQMAVVEKPNGELRICIDPQPLNKALQRERYKLPTVDDVLPQLNDAQVFSKLNVEQAYWHLKLDEPSSKLTTIIMPYGRYKWNRLPFVKVSSELFQKHLNSALSRLDGVLAVADDIIVFGRGNSQKAAEADHEHKLLAFQERCNKVHIRFNDAKAKIKTAEIKFMGHLISKDAIEPDPSKVEVIKLMPSLTDVSGIKRFCGMVQ